MSMIKAGSTNVVRYFMMRLVADGTAATGLTITTFDLQYTRELTASATKIDGIVGTGGAATHVDNKVYELDSTSSPGLYMVCFPDAAFAAGVDQVTLNLKYGATVFTEAQNIQLVAFDPFDTVRLGLTALPNAAADAAGGLPISDDGGLDIDVVAVTGTAVGTDGTNLTEAGGTGNQFTGIAAVGDVTNLSNLPTIPTNWITAAGINADAITAAKVAADVHAEAADAVWDEVITGALHNTTNSAGRRLRELRESGFYSDGFIYIDTVNGVADSTDYEAGTEVNPTNSIANANTIATSLGLSKFKVIPGSSITFAATQANQIFEGDSWTLALGGQSIDGTTIRGAAVSGICTSTADTQKFQGCIVSAVTIPDLTHLIGCGLDGTITAGEAGTFFFDNCHSAIAGTGSIEFDFATPATESNLNVRHHSGGWNISNMGAGAGTCNASFEGNGQIVWNATCAATSNASIRGNWKITDNASGAVTETLDDNQVGVDTLVTQVGTAGAGLTDLGGMSTGMKAEVNVEADTALTDYDGPTDTEMVAAFTEIKGATWSGTDTLEGIYDASGGSTPAAISTAVWEELTATARTAGTYGQLIKDDIDATISSAATATGFATNTKQDTMETTLNAAATTAELNKVPKSDGTTSWNATALGAINAEADTAIVTYGLDHLVSAAVIGADVTDNSIIAKMVDDAATADWDGYDNTTASLEALNVDTDAVKAVTDLINFGVAGEVDCNVESWNTTAITTALETAASLADAVWDEDIVAAHTTADTAGNIITDLNSGIIYGVVASGTNTTCNTDLTAYTADQLIGRVIIFTSGAADGEATDITDYVVTNGVITFTALSAAIAPTTPDTFKIV